MYEPTDIRSDFGWKLIAISNPFSCRYATSIKKANIINLH